MAGAVEVLERHAVDLGSDIAPEAVGDIHRNVRHDPALGVVEQGGGQVQAQVDQDDPPDGVEIDPGAGAGDLSQHALKQDGGGLPQDLRADDGEYGGGGSEQHHNHDREFVRSKVLDQLAHRALEIARLLALHHRHWAAVPHRPTAPHRTTRPHRTARTGRAAAPACSWIGCIIRCAGVRAHDNSSRVNWEKAIS